MLDIIPLKIFNALWEYLTAMFKTIWIETYAAALTSKYHWFFLDSLILKRLRYVLNFFPYGHAVWTVWDYNVGTFKHGNFCPCSWALFFFWSRTENSVYYSISWWKHWSEACKQRMKYCLVKSVSVCLSIFCCLAVRLSKLFTCQQRFVPSWSVLSSSMT